MKKLNKNEWVGVGVSLAFIIYIFGGSLIMNLFNPQSVVSNSTEVKVEDIVVGKGEIVNVGDTITVHYVGTLENGKVFDSSVDRGVPQSFVIGLGKVIKGWDIGLIGMRVGGTRKLTIPSNLAYGENAVGPIPPNSNLIFEVELLDVKKPTK